MMLTEATIEKAARAMEPDAFEVCLYHEKTGACPDCLDRARFAKKRAHDAIFAVLPDLLEECAKVALISQEGGK